MDRQEFHALMSRALAASPGSEAVGGLVPPGRVKSRVLEVHPPELSEEGSARLLRTLGEMEGLPVEAIGDELWLLRDEELCCFVDTLNPRFWQLHSTSPTSRATKRLVRRWTTRNVAVDIAWFPRSQLERLDGQKLWVKAGFSGDALRGPHARERRWRARFEGEAPEELLELLATSPRYARTNALSGVGAIVEEPGVGRVHVVADLQGGFVLAAGDFEVGASVVWNAIQRYEQFVTGLESRHRLGVAAVDGGGMTVTGDVAVIAFPEPVEDVEQLVAGLFTAKEPFRLWAVPKQVGSDEWEANAVDLHVGQPLRLEISPYRLRVLLEERTCGNTLARLLTNLQHHLDARSDLAEPALA